MRQPTADDVMKGYFESLKPSQEEVQAMIDQWPVIAEKPDEAEKDFHFALGFLTELATFFSTADLEIDNDEEGDTTMERALDMWRDFLMRTDQNDD